MTTYQETQESLGTLLERATQEGTIRIQRPNGQVFVLQSNAEQKSPLDVPGVDLHLNAQQIVEFIHAGRREQQ
jgi:hypothetical protein